MSIDPTWLFASFIAGGIGFVLFVYGKKQQRLPHLIAGIALMAYPYFTTTALPMTIVGVVICAALWWAVRMGY